MRVEIRHFLLCLLLFATQASAQIPTQTFADFEKRSYDDWTIHGQAFGFAPATGASFAGKIAGFGGSGFLCSLHPRSGNTATGKAVSQNFTITKPVITFKIGGGNHPGEACINLVLGGKVVRTQTGDDSPQLLNRFWDVSEFAGKTAHFEVVDATTSDQRGYILVDEIAFHGSDMIITPPIGEDTAMIEVPLRIIHVLDSQGNAQFSDGAHEVLTLATAQKQLRDVNEIFRSARLRFTLDPKDFETRRDDYLNLDFDRPGEAIDLNNHAAKPPQTGLSEHLLAFQKVADERPDRLTVIVHHGAEWRWSERTGKWIFGTGFSRGRVRPRGEGRGHHIRVCDTKPRVWAHELGHAFGLLHTSRDTADLPSNLSNDAQISTVCQEYISKGGDATHPEYAIDGDNSSGVRDTPPDPGIAFWSNTHDRSRMIQIRLPEGKPIFVFVSRDNVMASASGNDRFSNDQIRVMRRWAERWAQK